MRTSFLTLLLVPSLLVVAWLTNAATPLSFAGTAVLLCGGALTAGFILSMQRQYARPAGHGQASVARGIAMIFRFGIGLPVIACMVYAAMRMTAGG